MANINVGSHDKGFWDASNALQAKAQPHSQGTDADAAIQAAKAKPGADMVVIGADGKTSVHSLSIEDGYSEGKKVLLSELDRDPAEKVNSGKTPLAIDDRVASALKGQAAFLIDENNQVAYLGDDVDKTTPATMLKDAERFLQSPTRDKVVAAYQIAGAAGQPGHVDSVVAKQGLTQLEQDYRRAPQVGTQVGYLKPGATRTQMEGLVANLTTLAGQESSRVAALNGQLEARTSRYQEDLKVPTQKLSEAKAAWNRASQQETQAVERSAYNLREARMPNIHRLEGQLQEAQGLSRERRSDLDQAIGNRTQRENALEQIERLPREAESQLQSAQRLRTENRDMHRQVYSYVTMTLSQVSTERRSTARDLERVQRDLETERRKPVRPSGSGGAHTNDPFAGGNKPSGGGHTNDPFAGGNKPSGGGHTNDPFAGGSSVDYRDEGRIHDLERRSSRLSREHDDLRERERSLDSIQTRLTFTQDIDQISLLFYDLNTIDRMALGQYKDRHDRNERQISQHERTAQDKRREYEREVGPANQALVRARSAEEDARGAYAQAEGQVGQLQAQIQDLNRNPRPDSHAAVKPTFDAHQAALRHQTQTVGDDAPLTRTRDQAQERVDGINSSYSQDRQGLERQISDVQQGLRQDALKQIQQVRQQIR